MFRERTSQKLTEADRGSIVSLLREGRSVSYVASSLGMDRKTVTLWRDRFAETGHVKRAIGSGRPKSTTVEEDRRLLTAAKAKPMTTAQEIAGEFD